MTTKRARVVKSYHSEFPNPLQLQQGEIVRAIPKSTHWKGWIYCATENHNEGWIPISYLTDEKSCENRYHLQQDYDATEISVKQGTPCIIKKMVAGWAWIQTEHRHEGWIPLDHLEFV